MGEKVFRTYEEMIDLLKSRGIDISNPSDMDYARNVLSKVGYYNLINGYNKLFLSSNNPPMFIEGTTIQELNALYQFDRTLRNSLLRYILIVETQVKSLVAYHFSEVHGHKNYLIYSNFNTNLKDAESKITALIAEIQRQISYRCNDPSIEHYLKKHGYIPLWVLNNNLTLGTISKFYSLMLPQERQNVSRNFKIMDNELENSLLYLSNIRNFCAHGNRIYCYKTKRPLMDTEYHKSLQIAKSSDGEYVCGKRDLFACIIALKRLLSGNDFKRLCKEVYRAVGYLKKQLIVIKIEDILSEMGFPENWRNIRRL